LIFVTKLRFEFVQYMAIGIESLDSNASVMKGLTFFYVYLFIGRKGKSMQPNFLGNKKLPSLIENVISFFLDNCHLYQNEICPEVLSKFMELVLNSGMVCLSIFSCDLHFPSKSNLRI
jgi:hypothetical protein